ncbi:ribonuclease P protein component [Luteolibacter sp. AS25]|uniref:ribonuclease P protein component n=1 Tax=Luteolibacter sp. AS25 TaxID=3135776 RepID=UPI00398B2FF5
MRLPRNQTINQSADFLRIRKTGHAKAGRFVILSTLEDPGLQTIRTAFVTSKRAAKKAHDRNYLRRRFRSFVQKFAPEFENQQRFIVTIARPGAANADPAELEADWKKQASRLGLFPKSS